MYDNHIARQIAELYNQEPLTNFESLGPHTNIKSLNLNWREKDLPERIRTKHVHRIHPYMGKFIPQLVEIFIRIFQPKLVYDPFCGSGTTLVEANALGIESIGTDISIFNVLLTKAKTADYDLNLLHKEINSILNELSIHKMNNFSQIEDKVVTENEYINEWFAEQARKELLCYLHLIEKFYYKDLLKIILSRSARSARLVTHYDLDFPKKPQKEPYFCYKHGRTCSPVQEAYKFLNRYSIDTYLRIKQYSTIKTNADVKVIHGDSRNVELPKGIDFVFTSPPYLGLIDYHDQHKYAYELLGLKSNEDKEIGAAKYGQSDDAKKRYIEGINQVLLHTRDYMTENGIIIIVVNDKYNLYKPEQVGFEWVERVERHVNRRTGRRNGAFYESIFIWRKK